MKMVAGVAGVIVLIALAALYVIGATKPDRPEIVSGPLTVAAYDSSIDIPVAVSLEKIRTTLEEAAPRTLRGENRADIVGVALEDVQVGDGKLAIVVAATESVRVVVK